MTGDTIKADSIAQIILHKPVKVPSAEIDAMKEEAASCTRIKD